MQLSAPLPTLSKGGYSHPVIYFETAENTDAQSMLIQCYSRFTRQCHQGNSIFPCMEYPEDTLPLQDPGTTPFEGNLTLIPFHDFSALLLREMDDGPHFGEVFYHPLRLSSWLKPEGSRLHKEVQSPASLLKVLRIGDRQLSDAIQENLSEIVAFWDANPSFDARFNENGSTNMPWAMPLIPSQEKIAGLQREFIRLIAAFEMSNKFEIAAAIDFGIIAGSLRPYGKITPATLNFTGSFLSKNSLEIAKKLEAWVHAGLKSPCCPVPLHDHIIHQRPRNWTFSYAAEKSKLSRHEVFETRARMIHLMQD